MQWLIDLIIETIGIPPCFITRPDPVPNDFLKADFQPYGEWVTLDMSSVVPAGASAVLFDFTIRSTDVGDGVGFRKLGQTATMGIGVINVQVANLYNRGAITVGLSPDRKIEARTTGTGWQAITLKIRGWWL